MKRVFVLAQFVARELAAQHCMNAPEGHVVTFAEPSRTLEANAKMWAMLGEVAVSVEWYGKRLTAEDWKHIFSSSLRKLEVVPNLDGTGFVALGLSTSQMSKREMGDMIELIAAFGAERNVKFLAD